MPKNKIICVGTNCIVRKTLVNYGIKPSRKEGELSYPFDLCSMYLDSVVKILKNDFSDFLDDIMYLENEKCWVNRRYGIFFPHDKFKESEKDKFILRYKKRINNFNELFNREDKLIFVTALAEETIDMSLLNEIYAYLCKKMKNGNFDYLVFNFKSLEDRSLLNEINENITYEEIYYSRGDFATTWHKKAGLTYKDLAYEEEFVAKIVSHL